MLKLALQCQDVGHAYRCPIIGPGCLFGGVLKKGRRQMPGLGRGRHVFTNNLLVLVADCAAFSRLHLWRHVLGMLGGLRF